MMPREHRRRAGALWQSVFVVTLCLCAVLLVSATPVIAGDHYALVVTGAAGGDDFAKKYDALRTSFTATLREKLGYPADHIVVLADSEGDAVVKSTRENVERALADFRRRIGRDDVLLLLLIGHGTSDGEDGKFNLVGPDLTAKEWADLIRPIEGRVIFIDTSSASFPFLHHLAGKNRIVMTATDSSAQQFETVFPEFFVKAFNDPAADLDKNGRVSVWEAFSYAAAGVRQWFEQRGTLPTERPLLDDNGDGIGRESQTPGPDGAVARVTYLEREAAPAAATAIDDAALEGLSKRRDELVGAIDALKAKKSAMPVDQYQEELERILVELARVSHQLRLKSNS